MSSYADKSGRQADFEVVYRFYTAEQGGRKSPPHQHVRWDFLYAEDDPLKDGISMIWPEFVSEAGSVLPEGEVSYEGVARMFIVNPDRTEFHRARLKIGTRGYFVEGSHRVAECTVRSLLGLAASGAA
jgi:hypothetical protein